LNCFIIIEVLMWFLPTRAIYIINTNAVILKYEILFEPVHSPMYVMGMSCRKKIKSSSLPVTPTLGIGSRAVITGIFRSTDW